MACYKPLKGYRAKKPNESGKYSIVFNPRFGYLDMPMEVPCGQCIGCRIDRSQQWALRCMFEASTHEKNCFITLTYDDDHLPFDGNLNKEHFQLFMKRLRKQNGKGIKYFHCGEYGDNFGRPHYHALLFNYRPDDLRIHGLSSGLPLYTSEKLTKLWGKGHAPVGDLTYESAAYTARYALKKINGKLKEQHYTAIHPVTGEFQSIEPEYQTCSNGIGKNWFEQYHCDVYPHDYVVHNGKKFKVPKYFDRLFEEESPNELAKIKIERCKMAEKFALNNTPERLLVRENIQKHKAKLKKRIIE